MPFATFLTILQITWWYCRGALPQHGYSGRAVVDHIWMEARCIAAHRMGNSYLFTDVIADLQTKIDADKRAEEMARNF